MCDHCGRMRKGLILLCLLNAPVSAQDFRQTVVVTAAARPVELGSVTRTLTVITRQQIDALPVNSIAEVLRLASSVDVRARGFFPLETDLQSFYANMADRCAEVAVKAGVISEFEGRAWLDAFHEQGAQGPIVAGRLHIFVWGRKPL